MSLNAGKAILPLMNTGFYQILETTEILYITGNHCYRNIVNLKLKIQEHVKPDNFELNQSIIPPHDTWYRLDRLPPFQGLISIYDLKLVL